MLSESVKATIIKRRMNGESSNAIALDYDLSGSYVARLTRHLGIKTRPGRKPQGCPMKAIALHRAGLSRGTIVARLGTSHRNIRRILGSLKDSHNDCAISD